MKCVLGQAEAEQLRTGHRHGRVVDDHLERPRNSERRRLLGSGLLERGQQVDVVGRARELSDAVLPSPARQDRHGHAVATDDMVDQLAHRLALVGSVDVPLIGRYPGESGCESAGGKIECVEVVHLPTIAILRDMDSPTSSPLASAHRVGAAELFFDLVFVFAFTQVTTLLADEPTPEGFGKAAVVMALVWWSWAAYAWLTNARDSDHPAGRGVLLAGMAGMLIAGIGIPTAFGSGALLVAIGIGIARVVWIIAYHLASKDDPEYSAAVRRLGIGTIALPVLLILGAILGAPYQLWIWVVAVAIDYLAPLIAGTQGWKVDPQHFAERYGLIVIIALGETVARVGLQTAAGWEELPALTAVLAAIAGLLVAAFMWSAYFAHLAEEAEFALHAASGTARAAVARDAYTYAHLLPVAGIVLTVLGIEEALHEPSDAALPAVVVALCLGSATYLGGLALIAWRTSRIRWDRALAVAGVLTLLGMASVPAWVSGQESVPWAPLPGAAAIAVIAAAVAVVAFSRPTTRPGRG